MSLKLNSIIMWEEKSGKKTARTLFEVVEFPDWVEVDKVGWSRYEDREWLRKLLEGAPELLDLCREARGRLWRDKEMCEGIDAVLAKTDKSYRSKIPVEIMALVDGRCRLYRGDMSIEQLNYWSRLPGLSNRQKYLTEHIPSLPENAQWVELRHSDPHTGKMVFVLRNYE